MDFGYFIRSIHNWIKSDIKQIDLVIALFKAANNDAPWDKIITIKTLKNWMRPANQKGHNKAYIRLFQGIDFDEDKVIEYLTKLTKKYWRPIQAKFKNDLEHNKKPHSIALDTTEPSEFVKSMMEQFKGLVITYTDDNITSNESYVSFKTYDDLMNFLERLFGADYLTKIPINAKARCVPTINAVSCDPFSFGLKRECGKQSSPINVTANCDPFSFGLKGECGKQPPTED